MSINATFFAQLTVFFLLVIFTMKFVWPPIAKALDDRAQKIADGLSAADKAKAELTSANKRVEDELSKSKTETAARLADAERRAMAIVEEAKTKATEEGNKIIAAARVEAEQQTVKARRHCVSKWLHWLSRVPNRFCAKRSTPAFMRTC